MDFGIYSPSKHKLFNLCKRKWYLYYIEGWKETTKKPWLQWGSKIDELLQVYDLQGISKTLETIPSKFENEFDQVDCRQLLLHYHEKYKDEVYYPLELEGKPGNQFPFKISLKTPIESQIAIEGFIDKVTKIDGYVGWMERKTTTESITFNSEYWSTVQVDKQNLCYSTALTEILGKPVNKGIYEVLRKPNKSVGAVFNREGMEVQAYEERVSEWFLKPSKPMVARRVLWIDENARDEYIMDLLADHETIRNMVINQKELELKGISGQYAWPRNQFSCNTYGTCPYKDFCEGKTELSNIPYLQKIQPKQ